MTRPPVSGHLTAGVALLERALGYTLGSLHLVSPERMANRTPCAAWSLRQLLAHMNDSMLALFEAIAAGHVALEPAAGCAESTGNPAEDPVGALRRRGCRLLGAWVNASGPGEISVADRTLTPSIVAATGAIEITVHGWDVAQACGTDRPVPAELAEELLEFCPLLIRRSDRPGRFAEPVELAPDAAAGDRLIAFLGRRPGWGRLTALPNAV